MLSAQRAASGHTHGLWFCLLPDLRECFRLGFLCLHLQPLLTPCTRMFSSLMSQSAFRVTPLADMMMPPARTPLILHGLRILRSCTVTLLPAFAACALFQSGMTTASMVQPVPFAASLAMMMCMSKHKNSLWLPVYLRRYL